MLPSLMTRCCSASATAFLTMVAISSEVILCHFQPGVGDPLRCVLRDVHQLSKIREISSFHTFGCGDLISTLMLF